jgi:NAD(P)-dependent dehydrogenase (short-subunit alcohol dehydrogenase family)
MGMRLDGKVAIVTGGGTGIGAAVAERFACEGAKVVICGRRAEPLEKVKQKIERAGGQVVAVPCDSATEAGVKHLFEQALQAFGTVDILVNNAGIAGPVGFIWELDLAEWEETLRVNLTGPWLCSRAAATIMMVRRYGKIVNIGALGGKRPLPRRTPYTATKMGLVGLTRTLASELGEYNINVNLISPGLVETPRVEELASKFSTSAEEIRRFWASQAALKRVSEPEDVAALAAFLASDEARNITGIDITVDAGTWYS